MSATVTSQGRQATITDGVWSGDELLAELATTISLTVQPVYTPDRDCDCAREVVRVLGGSYTYDRPASRPALSPDVVY